MNIPKIMGIVNVTPDSFSDGGCYASAERAFDHACKLIDQGADVIDVGGESTRPGASQVSAAEEIGRIVPVIAALRARHTRIPISVDTSKPQVMKAACEAGATIINDVRALLLPGALETAAKLKTIVCLTHMQGTPQTMQDNPHYNDVVAEVSEFLQHRAAAARSVGIEDIWIDPGFGFGKTLTHNVALFHALKDFRSLGFPLLVGLSRKRMIAQITGRGDVRERTSGSVSAALIAAFEGVDVLRVHDVAETRDALSTAHALYQPERHATSVYMEGDVRPSTQSEGPSVTYLSDYNPFP